MCCVLCHRDDREEDGHTDKLLRALLIGLLDAFAYDDAETVREARDRFERHFETPSALPSEYKVSEFSM